MLGIVDDQPFAAYTALYVLMPGAAKVRPLPRVKHYLYSLSAPGGLKGRLTAVIIRSNLELKWSLVWFVTTRSGVPAGAGDTPLLYLRGRNRSERC